jgi:hypothetical protein
VGYAGSEGKGYDGSRGDLGYTGSAGVLPDCAGTDKIAALAWTCGTVVNSFYPVMVADEGTSTAFISKLNQFAFNAAAGSITIDGSLTANGLGQNSFAGPINSGPISVTGLITGTGNLYVAGNIIAKGNITGFGCFSDERLKKNITPIQDALGKIRHLEGIMYDWTDEFLEEMDSDMPKRDTGLIAQTVQEVLPEVVFVRDNGYLGIKYQKLVGLIVQAINELADKVDILSARLEE